MIKPWLSALWLVFLCGCFQVKDELVLRADGSGTVRLEVATAMADDMLDRMEMRGGLDGAGKGLFYPPINEAEAKQFFPANVYAISVKETKGKDNATVLLVEAIFKDVNAMLASPYGRAHALSIQNEKGALSLKALMGCEGIAWFAETKTEGMGFGEMPGLADLQKKKNQMRAEFRLTLPRAISSGNGARDGKTMSWVAERAKVKETEDFARQLGAVLEAGCGAEDVNFSPRKQPRLGLGPFQELQAEMGADPSAAPDVKKIAAAARFVPYALHITRSLDLSGEGGGRQNEAQLIGAIVLPAEFAPQQWGETKLEEVLDHNGKSLKPEADRANFQMPRFSGASENEEEEGSEPGASSEQRRMVRLQFQPPEWKSKEIARIKASMGLQYFGGYCVVKLTNAIPARWIADMSPNIDFDEPSGKLLSHPKLTELELNVRLQIAMTQKGMTLLALQVGGTKAALADTQVFDSKGKPWPTYLVQQDSGEEGTYQVMVAGQPSAPLSVALLVSTVGATVEVPILLEHVPVTGQ